MDTIKGLVTQFSTLIGSNLNGFFAGIAVALYFMWTTPPKPSARSQLGMPPLPGDPSSSADTKGDAKPEDISGDLDEV